MDTMRIRHGDPRIECGYRRAMRWTLAWAWARLIVMSMVGIALLSGWMWLLVEGLTW